MYRTMTAHCTFYTFPLCTLKKDGKPFCNKRSHYLIWNLGGCRSLLWFATCGGMPGPFLYALLLWTFVLGDIISFSAS